MASVNHYCAGPKCRKDSQGHGRLLFDTQGEYGRIRSKCPSCGHRNIILGSLHPVKAPLPLPSKRLESILKGRS